MDYAVSSKAIETLKSDCLVVALGKDPKQFPGLPEQTANQLAKLVKDGDFSGGKHQTFLLREPAGLAARRLLLIGTGSKEAIRIPAWGRLVAAAAKAVAGCGAKNAAWLLGTLEVAGGDEAWQVREGTRVLEESAYRFDGFRSEKPPAAKLKKWQFVTTGSSAGLNAAIKEGRAVGAGVNLARELGDTPPNVAFPKYLAQRARDLGRQYEKLSVKVISEKQAEKMGMGAFHAVSKGSEHEGQIIVMEYKGKSGGKPVSLVGKGITFDTGGISLKPGASMDEMKYDMGGAASVFGSVKAVCEMDLKVHLVAVVAAAENMPDGKASRPGDIVKTLSGQTVEILNTDAEGRLVLCDALTYVQNEYKPHTVVDMATLTGACVVALGDHACAVYSNDDKLSQALLTAGEHTGDRGWPMPLWEEYDEQLKSPFADMQNIGGPKAGSITAACFLQRFVKKSTKWAHLDIAGVAWNSGAQKGATGRPVPLLTRYLMDLAGK